MSPPAPHVEPGTYELSKKESHSNPSSHPVTDRVDGGDLAQMLASGAAALERNVSAVNALNVFPVPDGDTGTNMHLTLRSALEEAEVAGDGSVSQIAGAFAKGALMGARGNSGVILSQILRGFSDGMTGKPVLDGATFAAALKTGADRAYAAVTNPVEGTMLTVVRSAAQATEDGNSGPLVSTLRLITAAARDAVARTPDQLDVLKAAGVVDAGGQGLLYILEGMQSFLEGEPVLRPDESGDVESAAVEYADLDALEDSPYGYCTEFLIQGERLSVEAIRGRMESLGESVIVVGDEELVRVHLHVVDPGTALSYATGLAAVDRIKIENMQAQIDEFKAARGTRATVPATAVIAVAQGEGFSRVLRSLGVNHVIVGGQTMNPSTGDFLEAIHTIGSKSAILLPNNKNIIAAASQAGDQANIEVSVVSTTSVVQGIAAMLSFNPEGDLQTNLEQMKSSASSVVTIEVTRAVRSSLMDGREVAEGQYIALVDGLLGGVAESASAAVREACLREPANTGEFFTIYYGVESGRSAAEEVAHVIGQTVPGAATEIIQGGQSHYFFIISVE